MPLLPDVKTSCKLRGHSEDSGLLFGLFRLQNLKKHEWGIYKHSFPPGGKKDIGKEHLFSGSIPTSMLNPLHMLHKNRHALLLT